VDPENLQKNKSSSASTISITKNGFSSHHKTSQKKIKSNSMNRQDVQAHTNRIERFDQAEIQAKM
jgi:hypothetical protein